MGSGRAPERQWPNRIRLETSGRREEETTKDGSDGVGECLSAGDLVQRFFLGALCKTGIPYNANF